MSYVDTQLTEEKENVSNWSSECSLPFDTTWVATCQTKLKIRLCELLPEISDGLYQ